MKGRNLAPLTSGVVSGTTSEMVEFVDTSLTPPAHYRQRKPLATRHGEVTIWIDADALWKMLAARALLSKSGKAQIASGAIVAKRETFEDFPIL